MNFTPTDEQTAINNFAMSKERNLLIEARAGAAKTTTLEMLAHALRGNQILYLAFNVKIVEEMKQRDENGNRRLPEWCTAKTLNGLGYTAWMKQLNRSLVLERKKTQIILSDVLQDFDTEAQAKLNENFADLIKLMGYAKQAGYIPDFCDYRTAKPLCGDEQFFLERSWLNLESEEEEVIRLAMKQSIDLSLKGVVDFDDMIYMPTLFPAKFEHYPIVMVDEAQDLSNINHKMLKKVCKRSRLFAVGDPCQAIYGFRGAHTDSMNLLADTFDMARRHLTVSFRCPKKVTEIARRRAPDMKWPEWAKDGSVLRYYKWTLDEISDDAVVICRNNAPLLRLAILMLRHGRVPDLQGRDILRVIYNKMRKLGNYGMRRAQLLVEIEKWYQKELERNRDGDTPSDMRDAMLVFAEQGETLQESLDAIMTLQETNGSVKLMTGHRSKGLEFDKVFFLDEWLCDWEREQDFNLWYVICTRSQNELSFIDSNNWVEAYFDETEEKFV